MRENTLLTTRLTLKSGKYAQDELLGSNTREISFYNSDHQTMRRSPLDRLCSIRELIRNGFKGNYTVRLSFANGAAFRGIPKTITFPSSSISECRRFCMALKTIDILIENLENQYIATRRDIYYQDVDLFVNQRNIDSIVSVICTSLQYKDYEIGAVAAQKGLFWGEVTLVNQGDDDDDDTRQCFKSAENGVMLIPRLHNVEKIEVSDTIEYVLIIEKEAVFNALCNYSGFNSNRIMITGKGFPDVLTKTFVSRIARDNPGLMIWGIADLDPYGINILRQYKNGGAVNASLLKNELLEAISCPSLKPLRFSIVDFIGNKSSLSDLNTREAGIIISNFRKWRELKSTNDDDQFNSFARRELQRMMFFGKKCELNTIKMNRHEDEHGLVGTVKYIDELCLSRRAN